MEDTGTWLGLGHLSGAELAAAAGLPGKGIAMTARNAADHPLVELNQVTKVYQMGDVDVYALRDISTAVAHGEYVAVMGASGSGKSTLMNIIGLLDRPTSGSYRVNGVESSQLSQSQLADLRNREIGFVFQRFNLLARLSARRQVALPLFYANMAPRRAEQLALDALARRSSRAANSNGWRWLARWSAGPTCCWRMSPPARWIPRPGPSCWLCSTSCTGRG
jgi:ABC-type glutathione transport system ATPase component